MCRLRRSVVGHTPTPLTPTSIHQHPQKHDRTQSTRPCSCGSPPSAAPSSPAASAPRRSARSCGACFFFYCVLYVLECIRGFVVALCCRSVGLWEWGSVASSSGLKLMCPHTTTQPQAGEGGREPQAHHPLHRCVPSLYISCMYTEPFPPYAVHHNSMNRSTILTPKTQCRGRRERRGHDPGGADRRGHLGQGGQAGAFIRGLRGLVGRRAWRGESVHTRQTGYHLHDQQVNQPIDQSTNPPPKKTTQFGTNVTTKNQNRR